MEFVHKSVLLEETINALDILPDGIYVDGTAGGGGHSYQIARRLTDGGRLIAIDQDPVHHGFAHGEVAVRVIPVIHREQEGGSRTEKHHRKRRSCRCRDDRRPPRVCGLPAPAHRMPSAWPVASSPSTRRIYSCARSSSFSFEPRDFEKTVPSS